MIRRRFALALATITVSMFLAEAANALPLSTKTTTTSLTGAWKPLDWTTSAIADETNGLKQFNIANEPVFLLDYLASGTFVGTGYSGAPPSGTITVRYSFGTNFSPLEDEFFIPDFCVTAFWDEEKLRVSTTDTESPIGMVTVVDWSLDSNSPELNRGDTPKIGDTFFLFAENPGSFLEIAVDNGNNPKSFTATFPQLFTHLGPYKLKPEEEDDDDDCHGNGCEFNWDLWKLQTRRTNDDCLIQGATSCGSATFSSINVPEPGTLVLLGLGLAGLAVRRRSRQ